MKAEDQINALKEQIEQLRNELRLKGDLDRYRQDSLYGNCPDCGFSLAEGDGELYCPDCGESVLNILLSLANRLCQAQGIFLLRGVTDAHLSYKPTLHETPEPITQFVTDMEDLGLNVTLTSRVTSVLEIADTGILVLMRLPADDGELGIEVK